VKLLRLRLTNYMLFVWLTVSLAVLLISGVYFSTVDLRQFPGVPVILAATAGIAIAAGILFVRSIRQRGGDLYLTFPNQPWFGWLVILLGVLCLAIMWIALPPIWELSIAALPRLYFIGLIFIGQQLILRAADTEQQTVSLRAVKILVLVMILLALTLVIVFIGRVPHIEVFDEPYELSFSWAIFQTGAFTWPMGPQMMDARQLALYPYILHPLNGLWMSVAGLGLVQARLFFLVFGWASLLFIYLTARHLYGNYAALAAVAIGAFIPLRHDFIRPDMLIVLTTAAGLYLLVTARSNKSNLRHYLAGLVVAFGIEGHPYAIRFALAFAVIYLVEYGQLLRSTRRWHWYTPFWLFVLGGLTHAVFFVIAHMAIVPGGFNLRAAGEVSTIEVGFSANAQLPFLARILADNLLHYRLYFQLHMAEVLIALVAAIGAIRRWQSADKLLLAIWAVALALGAFMLVHVNAYSWIYNMPFMAILGGALIAQLAASMNRERVALVSVASLCLIVTALSSDTILTGTRPSVAEPFIEVGRKIDHLLPADIPTVIGNRVYYLAILDHRRYVALDELNDPYYRMMPASATALILTSFADKTDDYTDKMLRYAATAKLSKAYCFYVREYQIAVYVPTTKLPANAPIGCKP